MILWYSCILLAFCATMFFFVLRTVYSMVRDNLIETSSQSITRWTSVLTDTMEFARYYVLNLATSDALQQILREPAQYDQDSDSLEKTLLQNTALNQLISSNNITVGSIPFLLEITYRTEDGTYVPVYYSNRQNQTKALPRPADDSWVRELEQQNGQFLWDTYSNGSYEYVRLSKMIYDTKNFNRVLGSISVDFSYEHLALSVLHRLRNEAGVSSALYHAQAQQIIGYYALPVPDYDTLIRTNQSGEPLLIENGNACLFVRRLGMTDFYIIAKKSLAEAHTLYLKACKILFLAGSLALVLGLLLAFLVTRKVMKPVVQLSETMKNVQNGDLDIFVQTTEKAEIGELYHSFNYMIQMINQLIEENYVTRINQKQSELNALQSQINTHFLYNTLDSINWLAKDYHAGEISHLVTNLSTLLRTSLNNGARELTVEQELLHVRSYINIQMVRFQNLFLVREEIEPCVLNDVVIKMLLQPLVENAILHAFHQTQADPANNLLVLRVLPDQDMLLLQVSNPAPLQALDAACARLQRSAAEPAKSYGIQSIQTRLHIAYAQQAQFFYSMENGILTASIRIPRAFTIPSRSEQPILKEGNDALSCFDCR